MYSTSVLKVKKLLGIDFEFRIWITDRYFDLEKIKKSVAVG